MSLYGVEREAFEARFWSKVNKSDTCWLWAAGKVGTGYGKFRIGATQCLAHRVSLELTLNRHLQEGMVACHSCRNRHCVNPAHLKEGTRQDNEADKIRDGTTNRGERCSAVKLTAEDARHIKYSDNRPSSMIAKDYGVSARAVRAIKSGQNWAWL